MQFHNDPLSILKEVMDAWRGQKLAVLHIDRIFNLHLDRSQKSIS